MPADLWRSLDPAGPPEVRWLRAVPEQRICVLLGAFDPPTNAHLDVLRAAAEATAAEAVLGLTKVRLARSGVALWDDDRRLRVLDAIAARLGLGLVLANRGTYLDVDRTLRAGGYEPAFVVGTDKLAQLADPSFYSDGYEDGERGVEATFDEVRFVVIPRAGSTVQHPEGARDLVVLDPAHVFGDPAHEGLSASKVRHMIAAGQDVSGLVPPEVSDAGGAAG